MATYKPVQVNLGHLPEFPAQEKTYDFSSSLPGEVKEVLVYTFVTTHTEGKFHRGYYEISTKDGCNTYKQYLNVATGGNVAAVNSANMWFPAGDGKLTIRLVHPQDEKKSIAHQGEAAKSDDPLQGEWSSVFVTGYRV